MPASYEPSPVDGRTHVSIIRPFIQPNAALFEDLNAELGTIASRIFKENQTETGSVALIPARLFSTNILGWRAVRRAFDSETNTTGMTAEALAQCVIDDTPSATSPLNLTVGGILSYATETGYRITIAPQQYDLLIERVGMAVILARLAGMHQLPLKSRKADVVLARTYQMTNKAQRYTQPWADMANVSRQRLPRGLSLVLGKPEVKVNGEDILINRATNKIGFRP